MAGSDGNRGYLVQTLVALLDSVRSDSWERITIEPAHESQKIDVLWESKDTRQATQVKSSINQISKRDAERWAKELEANASADNLQLILVGPCSKAVARIGEFGNVSIPCPKNLDLDGLLAEAAHLLDKFLCSIQLKNESPHTRELIVRGLVTELSCFASNSRPMDRSEFVAMLIQWTKNSGVHSLKLTGELELSTTYAGGSTGTCVAISIFNAGTTPHYLNAWFAEWGGEQQCLTMTAECENGTLPFRVQEQDRYSIVVNLGHRGFEDLAALGVVDGSNNRYSIPQAQLNLVVDDGKRYSVLYQKQKSETELAAAEAYGECEMGVKAKIETDISAQKTLVVEITNKSQIDVPLAGAKLEWIYDPPRVHAIGPDSDGPVKEAQQIGGSVSLACRSDLPVTVLSGATVQFYVNGEISRVLTETLLGDVPDANIAVVFGTSSGVGWKATEDGIPELIKEYAKYMLAQSKTASDTHNKAAKTNSWIEDVFAQKIPEVEFSDGTNVVSGTDYIYSIPRTTTWYIPHESQAATNWVRHWERIREHFDGMAFVKRPLQCTMIQTRTPGYHLNPLPEAVDLHQDFHSGGSGLSREFSALYARDQFPIFSDHAIRDATGEPICNSADDAFGVRFGLHRMYILKAGPNWVNEDREEPGPSLAELANECAKLLFVLPPAVAKSLWRNWPEGFDRKSNSDEYLWFDALFELAWQGQPGARLYAERSAPISNGSIGLIGTGLFPTIPPSLGLFSERVAHEYGHPVQIVSHLENLVSASISAIDEIIDRANFDRGEME